LDCSYITCNNRVIKSNVKLNAKRLGHQPIKSGDRADGKED
jgi:hypothetical protein